MTRRDHVNGISITISAAAPVTAWSSGSLWKTIVGLVLAPLLGIVGAYVTAAPSRPLHTGRALAELDLRPQWEQHPHLDMFRRGERDWQSGLELVSSGWRRIRLSPKVEKVLISFALAAPGITHDEARRRMGLPAAE